MTPRVTWRLVSDDPESSMPALESSMLPQYGDTCPIWVRKVSARDTPDGIGEVIIDYVLGEAEL